MKESLRTLTKIVGAIALYELGNLAFSKSVRQEIGRRDGWKCQTCGNSFQQGYMVQAAHYDHDRSNPDYDDPSNGRILCTQCHIDEERENGHLNSVRLLERTQTIYTFDRQKNPDKYGGQEQERPTGKDSRDSA